MRTAWVLVEYKEKTAGISGVLWLGQDIKWERDLSEEEKSHFKLYGRFAGWG